MLLPALSKIAQAVTPDILEATTKKKTSFIYELLSFQRKKLSLDSVGHVQETVVDQILKQLYNVKVIGGRYNVFSYFDIKEISEHIQTLDEDVYNVLIYLPRYNINRLGQLNPKNPEHKKIIKHEMKTTFCTYLPEDLMLVKLKEFLEEQKELELLIDKLAIETGLVDGRLEHLKKSNFIGVREFAKALGWQKNLTLIVGPNLPEICSMLLAATSGLNYEKVVGLCHNDVIRWISYIHTELEKRDVLCSLTDIDVKIYGPHGFSDPVIEDITVRGQPIQKILGNSTQDVYEYIRRAVHQFTLDEMKIRGGSTDVTTSKGILKTLENLLYEPEQKDWFERPERELVRASAYIDLLEFYSGTMGYFENGKFKPVNFPTSGEAFEQSQKVNYIWEELLKKGFAEIARENIEKPKRRQRESETLKEHARLAEQAHQLKPKYGVIYCTTGFNDATLMKISEFYDEPTEPALTEELGVGCFPMTIKSGKLLYQRVNKLARPEIVYDGEAIHSFDGRNVHISYPHILAVSPDERFLLLGEVYYSPSVTTIISKFDLERKECHYSFGSFQGEISHGNVWWANNKTILVDHVGGISLFNEDDLRKPIKTWRGWYSCGSMSPDGRYATMVKGNEKFKIIEISNNRVVKKFKKYSHILKKLWLFDSTLLLEAAPKKPVSYDGIQNKNTIIYCDLESNLEKNIMSCHFPNFCVYRDEVIVIAKETEDYFLPEDYRKAHLDHAENQKPLEFQLFLHFLKTDEKEEIGEIETIYNPQRQVMCCTDEPVSPKQDEFFEIPDPNDLSKTLRYVIER